MQDLPLEVTSLRALQLNHVFPERGLTFLENARGKSLFYSRYWKGLTLAEDSGLEIDFLKGSPGVYSSRFAGPNASDEENLRKVLRLLNGIPYAERQAHFVSCMVLSKRENIVTEIQEKVAGFITAEKRGRGGFGYDPIFYYPPLKKTFAELSTRSKNEVSHRGRALKKLIAFLHEYLELKNS